MTRSIEKNDLTLGCLDPVCADMLRDGAELLIHDLALAVGIEQSRLAVIDVTHDRDDGGALDESVFIDL